MLNAASPGDQAYDRGVRAESHLDLFGARNHFRQALEQPQQQPGAREHIAWFLYRHGFHDRQCLSLMEEIQPRATHPDVTRKAIRHLRMELGLEPPTAGGRAANPRSHVVGSSPVARLQRARELYWTGAATKAREAYGELIEQYPKEPALRWELSKVLVSSEAYEEAARQLELARNIRPHEPELILAQADVEARRGNRTRSLAILGELELDDAAPLHLVRAHAHHYSGEFIPAAREYRKVLASRPHHEIAAHGLAECSLRNNSIPEAKNILQSWSSAPQTLDWGERFELDHELTAPRLRVASSYFENSPDYEAWSLGADLHLRPRPELDIGVAVTAGWFDQPGFESVDRQTVQASARYQNCGAWSIYGSIGVNDYDNDWTSLVGGLGVMLRPISSLDLNISVSHLDVVDSEPPMGIALYDLASTIGAVAGKADMDALTATARWQPIENIELFGKYRLATLEGDNTLDDAYAEISWILSREPMLRIGYGVAYLDVEDPSPVHTEGAMSTSYYYDPDSLVVHNLFIAYANHNCGKLSYGAEGHVYLQPEHDTTGFGLFGYLRYDFDDHHAVQLDARYYTQNRGRNRDQSASGHYHALNLVAVYEYRF